MSSGVRRRKRLATLRRRADFLQERIQEIESGGGDPDRDRAEHAALRWALEELDPPLASGPGAWALARDAAPIPSGGDENIAESEDKRSRRRNP